MLAYPSSFTSQLVDTGCWLFCCRIPGTKALFDNPVNPTVGDIAALIIPHTGTTRQPNTSKPCTITETVLGTANCQKLTPKSRTQLIGNMYFRQAIMT